MQGIVVSFIATSIILNILPQNVLFEANVTRSEHGCIYAGQWTNRRLN